jgi:EF hand
MRPKFRLLVAASAFVGILLIAAVLTDVQAQPPGGKGGKGGGSSETVDEFVAKLMAFNKAKDGKLTKAELTDTRLLALFDRADTNKDGVVTREELEALFKREKLEGGFFGGPGGPGGGPKGFKGGPQPGQILPMFIQDQLNLTDSQKKQVADLQKEVDAKLDKILTAEQRTQMREMFGPGGFGKKKSPDGPGDKKAPPPDK